MHRTSPAVPLTSYAETPPTTSSSVYAFSTVLTPFSKKVHRHRIESLSNDTIMQMSNSSGVFSGAADLRGFPSARNNGGPTREHVSQCTSRGASIPPTDLPLTATDATSASTRPLRRRAGWLPSASLSRGGSDPPLPDTIPLTTFTSHVRRRLAMWDAGTDRDTKDSTSNNSSNELTALEKEIKAMSLSALQPPPRASSLRVAFTATSMTPAATTPSSEPLTTTATATTLTPTKPKHSGHVPQPPPPRQPISSKNVISLVDFAPSAADLTVDKMDGVPECTSCEDRQLNAISRELTSLLQKSNAVMEKLAQSHRPLHPEQLRCLAHMQQLSTSEVPVPELCRDVLDVPVAMMARARVTDDASQIPVVRMMVRSPRNVTFQ